MRHVFAILALAALTACGVDGVPERPGRNDDTSKSDSSDWISGTVSMHTATRL